MQELAKHFPSILVVYCLNLTLLYIIMPTPEYTGSLLTHLVQQVENISEMMAKYNAFVVVMSFPNKLTSYHHNKNNVNHVMIFVWVVCF